ncbi:DUF4019 domain-containing protein [Variovorax sp. HJSM1_2]|uniref:DUF4019 domain-containing protein n=1 Tax=Variovorax sp. HJSM1_2 TaxID=3366263 RepID=UPI003BCBF33B
MQRRTASYAALALLASLSALGANSAWAQAKPKTPAPAAAAPASAPAAAAPAEKPAAADPEATQKAVAAQLAAAGWLTLLDQRNWGVAWDGASQQFRSAVPIGAWMDGMPKMRAPFGAFIERVPTTAIYNPDNGFVTSSFNSKFANKADLVETVTTIQDADGKWRVTGYATR